MPKRLCGPCVSDSIFDLVLASSNVHHVYRPISFKLVSFVCAYRFLTVLCAKHIAGIFVSFRPLLRCVLKFFSRPY